MYYYRTLYDFTGADENELSVSTGDILSSESPYNPEDWIPCTVYTDSSRKGFVPGSYVAEISENDLPSIEATSPSTPSIPVTPRSAPNPSKTSSIVSSLLLRSERFSRSALSKSPAFTSSRLRATNPSLLSSSRVRLRETQHRLKSRYGSQSQITNEGYEEILQKHEASFKEICAHRDSMFNDITNTVNEITEKTVQQKQSVKKALEYLDQIDVYLSQEQKRCQVEDDDLDIDEGVFNDHSYGFSSHSVLDLEA
ncbi:hypothetical protein GEMRC1_010481 [Eukaryota sp. GEM-RC1]